MPTPTVNMVLEDLLARLKEDALAASRRGIQNATTLALEADKLVRPLLMMNDSLRAEGIRSIASGLKFGLAKIAEDEVRAYFTKIIKMATGYAGMLLTPKLK